VLVCFGLDGLLQVLAIIFEMCEDGRTCFSLQRTCGSLSRVVPTWRKTLHHVRLSRPAHLTPPALVHLTRPARGLQTITLCVATPVFDGLAMLLASLGQTCPRLHTLEILQLAPGGLCRPSAAKSKASRGPNTDASEASSPSASAMAGPTTPVRRRIAPARAGLRRTSPSSPTSSPVSPGSPLAAGGQRTFPDFSAYQVAISSASGVQVTVRQNPNLPNEAVRALVGACPKLQFSVLIATSWNADMLAPFQLVHALQTLIVWGTTGACDAVGFDVMLGNSEGH
jgi:hypothetical protein